jgi:DNA-binding winged helix-turn-helix (wHTH) protein/tetratricopeptide (TPR) repeat protein
MPQNRVEPVLDSPHRHLGRGNRLLRIVENQTGTWRFGVYEVDTRKLQLRRSGVTVKLREQPFRILVHLLEHAGEIVTREDLRILLWPADTYVDFDHSLNTAVMKLRGALGDPANAPMYVETIPRRGYRFIAPATFVADTVIPASAVEPAPPPARTESENSYSISVLPFKCTGSDPEIASFAEGVAEEIASGLQRFPYLRVHRQDIGARFVLDGALRHAGSKLRATIRLIDSESGENLSTETYEQPFQPDSLFDLQDYLVPRVVSTFADCRGILPRTICNALRSNSNGHCTPSEAVLHSFIYLDRIAVEEHGASRALLERAIESSPDQSLCWAMLSLISRDEYAHGFNCRPDPIARACSAAQRAIEIDPANHLAYHALASAHFFRKDFDLFRTAADRAMELNPTDGFSIASLGFLIAYSGEWELGCALAERADDLNPYKPGWYWFAHLFNAYRKGDYSAAIDIGLRTDTPQFWQTNLVLAAAYGQLGNIENARRSLEALDASRPGFSAIAREELSKWWHARLVDHLLDGLHKAEANPPLEDRTEAPPPEPLVATEEESTPSPAPVEEIDVAPALQQSKTLRTYLPGAAVLIVAIIVLIAFYLLHSST